MEPLVPAGELLAEGKYRVERVLRERVRWFRILPFAVALAIGGGLAATEGRAAAQSAADTATAKAAIKQARELRSRGDYAGALPKFQAAYALVPTPPTGLDLGRTLVSLGQLVQAREVLVAVTRM